MTQRGSMTLWGLILCGLIGLATIVAGSSYEMFARVAREAQIRSRLTALESQVRTMAFQPYSYLCGSDVGQNAVSPIASCSLVTTYYDNVKFVKVPGANCANGPDTCGFRMTQLAFSPNGAVGRFQATIVYEGREANLHPSIIDLEIPVELLQSSTFDCALSSPDKPAFVGFDGAGSPVCRGFTPVINDVTGATGAEGQACPQGSYLTYVEWNTLKFYCKSLKTPDKVVLCPAGQAIQDVSWAAGTLKANCRDLPSAPFNP